MWISEGFSPSNHKMRKWENEKMLLSNDALQKWSQHIITL
jgi:hypothetical protein